MNGGKEVVDAVAEGMAAARSIDAWLGAAAWRGIELIVHCPRRAQRTLSVSGTSRERLGSSSESGPRLDCFLRGPSCSSRSRPGILFQWFDCVFVPIHEGGHLLFRFFGECIRVAGGTFLQLSVPFALAAYFVFHRQVPGMAFCAVLFIRAVSCRSRSIWPTREPRTCRC